MADERVAGRGAPAHRAAAEMQRISKSTGVRMAKLIGKGWEAVRQHYLKLEAATVVDVDAIYKKGRNQNG